MKKLMNFRPALFCAVAIIIAVVSSYLIFVKNKVGFGVLIISLLLLSFVLYITVCAFTKKDKLKTAIIFTVVAALMSAAAFLRFYSVTFNYKKADLGDPPLTVSGKIDAVKQFDGGVNVVLSSVEYSGRYNGGNGYKMSVNIYGSDDFDVGEKIKFYAIVEDKYIFYEGKFRASDVENGVKYFASVNSSEVKKTGVNLTLFERINVGLRDQLKKGLNKDEFTVAYALILGNSDYSESDVLTSYRQAGVAHIFAVSGLHIGFMAAILGFLLRKTKINPYISAAIICSILFLYSGVCGFSASSIRATVMCAVALFVSATGGRYDGLTSVSLAAILIILISPVQMFCAGFVLSFAVVIGIMLAAKPIGNIFAFLPRKLRVSVGAVLAAWLFSAPILLLFFNELSLFAVVSNLIFIPVVGVIYVFIIISVILSFISPTTFLLIPNFVLTIINSVVGAIDYEPFIVGGITLTLSTLFYYAALILPTGLINIKTATKVIATSVFAAVFCLTTVIFNVRDNNVVKAYVSGSYGVCATVVEGKEDRTVLLSFAKNGFPLGRIKRILNESDKPVDVMVAVNEDINLTVTRLSAITTIRTVYYYEGEFGFLKNSFKSVDFKEVGENAVERTDYTLSFAEKGRAFTVEANGKVALIFSEFKNGEADFSESKNEYDIIVAFNYLERISATYNYEKFLSYRNSLVYPDAERSGYYLFKFN